MRHRKYCLERGQLLVAKLFDCPSCPIDLDGIEDWDEINRFNSLIKEFGYDSTTKEMALKMGWRTSVDQGEFLFYLVKVHQVGYIRYIKYIRYIRYIWLATSFNFFVVLFFQILLSQDPPEACSNESTSAPTWNRC